MHSASNHFKTQVTGRWRHVSADMEIQTVLSRIIRQKDLRNVTSPTVRKLDTHPFENPQRTIINKFSEQFAK